MALRRGKEGERRERKEWKEEEDDKWKVSKIIWHQVKNEKKRDHFGESAFSSYKF